MHCHSHGCDPKDVLEAIGLDIKDIYHKPLDPVDINNFRKNKEETEVIEEFLAEAQIITLYTSNKRRGNTVLTIQDVNQYKTALLRCKTAIRYLESLL